MTRKFDGEVFAKRLKQLRIDRDLTQQELADSTGTTRAGIGHYEYNQRQPRFETIQRLATFFGVSVDYLIGNSDIKNEDDATKYLIEKLKEAGFIKNDAVSTEDVDRFIEAIKLFKEYSEKMKFNM